MVHCVKEERLVEASCLGDGRDSKSCSTRNYKMGAHAVGIRVRRLLARMEVYGTHHGDVRRYVASLLNALNKIWTNFRVLIEIEQPRCSGL
jgi:hypothetical protein